MKERSPKQLLDLHDRILKRAGDGGHFGTQGGIQ